MLVFHTESFTAPRQPDNSDPAMIEAPRVPWVVGRRVTSVTASTEPELRRPRHGTVVKSDGEVAWVKWDNSVPLSTILVSHLGSLAA